jgi:hypothetical protein
VDQKVAVVVVQQVGDTEESLAVVVQSRLAQEAASALKSVHQTPFVASVSAFQVHWDL